jgi:hypothetical protein
MSLIRYPAREAIEAPAIAGDENEIVAASRQSVRVERSDSGRSASN